MTIQIPKSCKFLSDFISELPSHCLIDKGITGCGGTTLEINTPRNSIILSPTKNLVESKKSKEVLGVTGDTKNSEINEYLKNRIGYRKIIVTYDSLERVMNIIKTYQDYFLLIDEYHLLFNDYSFRNEAIVKILNNFTKFSNWAFLTATPIKEEFILKELENIPKISYKWEGSVPVDLNIIDTYYIQKEIVNLIETTQDKNLHIFLNSITTINNIVKKINSDYRIVCSDTSKKRVTNYAKVTDPIKKVNFYTSCAFEGCDIYDENGYCVIVSDTNLATTVLDISTKVRQVCGRIRNTKYKNKCLLILNTNKHRYASTTSEEFNLLVKQAETEGKLLLEGYKGFTEQQYKAQMKLYDKDKYYTMYINKNESHMYYDENLKKLDIYNYHLISEIYNSSISVLQEAEEDNFKVTTQKTTFNSGLTWIVSKLKEFNKVEFTYPELEQIFSPLFKEYSIKWSQKSISKYFPEHTKKRKQVNKVQTTYYKFIL